VHLGTCLSAQMYLFEIKDMDSYGVNNVLWKT